MTPVVPTSPNSAAPRALLLIIALALIAFAAACGGDEQSAPTDATIYLLNAEGALMEQDLPVTGEKDSLVASLEGLIDAPRDAGLSSGLPTGTELRSAEQAGSIALVDLNSAFAEGFPSGGSQAQTEVLAPLVYTATGVDGIDSVSLTVDGEAPDITGLAYDLVEPLTRDDLPIELDGVG